MVALFDHSSRFTPTEYLEWEEQQDLRYEYVYGEVYAMTGGTLNHSQIAVNFTTIIRSHLRGKGCKVFNSDAKVEVLESSLYLYPDLSVTCDDRDKSNTKFISYPCLIAEVLSPSTEAYDRGNKFALYRRSMSLQEYVLVSTQSMVVDIYRRNDRGKWELTAYNSGDEIELESIDLKFSIEQLFEDIIFEL
jgi:Uma2 family endonuclease